MGRNVIPWSHLALLVIMAGCAGPGHNYGGAPDPNYDQPKDDYRPAPVSSRFKVRSIKFFEGGDEVPERDSRQYSNTFSAASARYIYCEVELYNPSYGKGDARYEFVYRYYKGKREMFGEARFYFTLQSEWEGAVCPAGYGWPEAGNWTPATYRVEVWIEGEKAGENSFTVTGIDKEVTSNTNPNTFKLEHIKLFESAHKPPDKASRKYIDFFNGPTTRYIHCEILYTNPYYQRMDKTSTLSFRFYRSDGVKVGDHTYDINVPSTWNGVLCSGGWGNDTMGSWSAGSYRVEVFIDNQKIGERSFTVH